MAMVYRAFKIRAYPTLEQRRLFARSEGACRFVRRKVLEEMNRYHQETGLYKTVIDMSREVTLWKREPHMAWLKEVPSGPINQELRDLGTAFQHFFAKRAQYPKKARKQFACAIRMQLDQRQQSLFTAWAAHLVKIPSFGILKIAQPERLPPVLPKMITLSRDAMGRYFVSFGVEVNVEALPPTQTSVGVDVGLRHLAVLSDGQKIDALKALKTKERRLKRYQRMLSRKVGSRQGEQKSKRWLKQRAKVGRLHCRISDARRDYIHKVSLEIVRKADVVAIEDLNVKGLFKNRRLSKALADGSFRMLRSFLEYKARWYGREVLTVDRFAPTSKTCSCCGYKLDELRLSVREWDCPQCGVHHDRDINAARNVLDFAVRPGLAGGSVSPCAWRVKPPEAFGLTEWPMEPDEARTDVLSQPHEVMPSEAWTPNAE